MDPKAIVWVTLYRGSITSKKSCPQEESHCHSVLLFSSSASEGWDTGVGVRSSPRILPRVGGRHQWASHGQSGSIRHQDMNRCLGGCQGKSWTLEKNRNDQS